MGPSGGALQISAGLSITIGNNGVINASGGCNAGGGGAGGAVLLEAPTITVQGVVAANGASGGNQPTPAAGEYGHPGNPNDQPATDEVGGGPGSAGATVNGGAGMTTSDAGTPAGGGGAGWIRFNTGCLTVAPSAIVSPYLSPKTTCATVGTLK
jgi:hypothetical protein